MSGSNRKAADKVIKAMRAGGFLSDEAEARVVAFRELADAVDDDPSNASLWREYRAAEVAVLELRGEDDDDHAAFLRGRAALVNQPN